LFTGESVPQFTFALAGAGSNWKQEEGKKLWVRFSMHTNNEMLLTRNQYKSVCIEKGE
jgi:hypothetical protein